MKESHVDQTKQQLADERLKRLLERSKDIPPFLRNEVERLDTSSKGGENSTH